jgi:uncharacterized membrane protein
MRKRPFGRPMSEIEPIAVLRARAEQRLGHHQRLLENVTSKLGRPATLYVLLGLVAAWGTLNAAWPLPGMAPDPPPFPLMQGTVAFAGLLMTTLVLITENRQSRDADLRADLDLQVNLATEAKVAKLIALIEELRRDMPMVPDRDDPQAQRMQATVDPTEGIEAIERIDRDDPG